MSKMKKKDKRKIETENVKICYLYCILLRAVLLKAFHVPLIKIETQHDNNFVLYEN